MAASSWVPGRSRPRAVHAFDIATGQHLWTANDPEGAVGASAELATNDAVVAVGDPFGSEGTAPFIF
jgi:hypothetical protein